jgi:hypothetical protein
MKKTKTAAVDSTYGAHKTVEARFWPHLSGQSSQAYFKFFCVRSEMGTPAPRLVILAAGANRVF